MDNDERAIRELIAEWLRASRAGEAQTVLRLMAEDVVFLQAGQEPMRGRAAFAAAQASLQGMEIDARAEVEEVRVYGDHAWALTRLRVSATPPGKPTLHRAGHTLTIFARRDGAWVLLRDANMLSRVD